MKVGRRVSPRTFCGFLFYNRSHGDSAASDRFSADQHHVTVLTTAKQLSGCHCIVFEQANRAKEPYL